MVSARRVKVAMDSAHPSASAFARVPDYPGRNRDPRTVTPAASPR